MPKDTTKKNNKANNGSKKDKKGFFKDFKGELKKVIWLTPKQVVNNTVAVLTIVLLTAVIIAVLDIVFEKVNTTSVNALRKISTSQNSQAVQDSNDVLNTLNEAEVIQEDTANETM